MKKVLFVCTGNTCRSPMAAALYNEYFAPADTYADSAGLFVLHPAGINHLSAQVLKTEYNIVARDHTAKQVSGELIEQADLAITMTRGQSAQLAARFPQHKQKIYSLGRLAGQQDLDIADPYGADKNVYRQTAEEIMKLLELARNAIEEICTADQDDGKCNPV